MSAIGVIFLIINILLLLLLPRRLATIPLLLGACYMTLGQVVMVGPLHWSFIRIAVLAGLLRALMRGERPAGGMNQLDWIVLAWAAWALIVPFFRQNPTATLISHLGLTYNACGIYFLIRIFCTSLDDIVLMCRAAAIILVLVGVAMTYEKLMGYNIFSVLGGVRAVPAVRIGGYRAQGPFLHPILAGTTGAVTIPMIAGLWTRYRAAAIMGILACLAMTLTCHSSGPILSVAAGVFALAMWRYRNKTRNIRWLVVLGYVMLDMVMRAPAYWVIARFDITGGSTGWHRAALIKSAFEHLREWWIFGTDYTRHWMISGVPWSPDHTDITNHYLQMGVTGGLPLMILYILTLMKAFSYVGRTIDDSLGLDAESKFMVWALGSSLFAHAISNIGIAYFDQSFVFLYMTVAAINCAYLSTVQVAHDHEYLHSEPELQHA